MANQPVQDLTALLKSLWHETQGHPGRFLARAYPEARSPASAVEVCDALVWLNSTNLRPTLRTLRLHVLTNFVVQGIQDPLELFLLLLGLNPRIEYHQPYTLQADVSGAEAVALLVDYDKLRSADSAAGSAMIRNWLTQIRQSAPGSKILLNEPFFPPPYWPVMPEHENGHRRQLEQELSAAAEGLGVTVVRWNEALQGAGTSFVHRASHYVHYDQLLTRAGLSIGADVLARYVSAHFIPRKKVVCLDADNTLWQGIVGEDGADGVLYQPDSPNGRCYHRVLQHLKQLSEAGILLAIASKNNENEVLEVLSRADFPLKREDFSALRINWQSKTQNLRELAEELNLGLDSFVFVDDSDFEISEVRSNLPEVVAVQVPKRAEEYLAALMAISGLDRLRSTAEDRTRKQEYRAQAERRRLQAEEPLNFTRKLGITVKVKLTSADEVPRISQLLMKTNQFRLTPSRPGEEEVKLLLRNDHWRVLSVFYRDVFGDSGLIAGALLERQAQGWRLRNMVMSCRVLGRGVEEALVNDWAQRFEPLRVDFEATGRNQVAALTLERLGWKRDEPLSPVQRVESLELLPYDASSTEANKCAPV